MKKIFWGLLCLGMLGLFSAAVQASPKESMDKLAAACRNPSQMPKVALSDAEIDELTAYIKTVYKEKEGKDLTDKQAAVFIGQMSGMMGMAEHLKTAFGRGGARSSSASEAAPQKEKVLPSGVLSIHADALRKKFDQNQFAAEKMFMDKNVLINGVVRTVEMGTYFKDGKFVSGAPKAPLIRLKGGFTGYFLQDSFDFSQLQPEDAVNIYCSNIQYVNLNIQGTCQVAAAYRIKDGQYHTTYKNEPLQMMLATPTK